MKQKIISLNKWRRIVWWVEILYKKVCATLNYIEGFLILLWRLSTITGCILIYTFASLIGILIGITTSAIALKICVTATRNKRYKSIIKKKKNKVDNIVLPAKSELNSIEVLISKGLIVQTLFMMNFL